MFVFIFVQVGKCYLARIEPCAARRIQFGITAMQALGLVWGNIDPLATDLKEQRIPIEYPVQFGARLLFDHWQALDARGGLVVGRDVPSRKLASVLRNLALFVPIDGGADFGARLAGTAYMRRFGCDITGLALPEIFDHSDLACRRAEFAEILRDRRPSLFDVKLTRGDREVLRFETLGLPVTSPDRRETWILSGLFYSDWT